MSGTRRVQLSVQGPQDVTHQTALRITGTTSPPGDDLYVDDGVLSVTADDEPNEIVALRDGDLLVVHVDGDSCIANSADILHLAIDARGGDDRIGVQDGVEQTTTLDGGWRWTVAGEMM